MWSPNVIYGSGREVDCRGQRYRCTNERWWGEAQEEPDWNLKREPRWVNTGQLFNVPIYENRTGQWTHLGPSGVPFCEEEKSPESSVIRTLTPLFRGCKVLAQLVRDFIWASSPWMLAVHLTWREDGYQYTPGYFAEGPVFLSMTCQRRTDELSTLCFTMLPQPDLSYGSCSSCGVGLVIYKISLFNVAAKLAFIGTAAQYFPSPSSVIVWEEPVPSTSLPSTLTSQAEVVWDGHLRVTDLSLSVAP